MIQIDVKRDDGQITRLSGVSGMAVCSPALGETPKATDPPAVSLRCNSPSELAWNLAALMGAVFHLDPIAFATALELMDVMSYEKPQIRQMQPRFDKTD
jgi:hypothetical protein